MSSAWLLITSQDYATADIEFSSNRVCQCSFGNCSGIECNTVVGCSHHSSSVAHIRSGLNSLAQPLLCFITTHSCKVYLDAYIKNSRPAPQRPKPPFDKQDQQSHPGSEEQMSPRADHGEKSYQGSDKLKDHSVLITGADSGIGRAVAIACAREGADVAIVYLEEDADAKETCKWIEKAGRKSISLRGDIQDAEFCRSLVKKCYDQFGRLDVLINNAAYQMAQTRLEDFSEEQIERTFRTNILAMYYLCQAAVPLMNKGGAIINTASIQAYEPSPELLDYAPTKAAIINFTKALSKIVIKQGIRVNAVAPGPFGLRSFRRP